MLRISISAVLVSLFCISCGNEKNETASDVNAKRRSKQTCNQTTLHACFADEKHSDAACYAKAGCNQRTGYPRGQTTRECRISAICE